jgi:hypothetical protein
MLKAGTFLNLAKASFTSELQSAKAAQLDKRKIARLAASERIAEAFGIFAGH